jgi:hypothetical protein
MHEIVYKLFGKSLVDSKVNQGHKKGSY